MGDRDNPLKKARRGKVAKNPDAAELSKGAEKTAHNAHTESYSKQTVVLFDRQLGFLRHLQADVQTATGKKVSISEMLRALVEVLEAAGVEPDEAAGEEELKRALLQRMGGKG